MISPRQAGCDLDQADPTTRMEVTLILFGFPLQLEALRIQLIRKRPFWGFQNQARVESGWITG